MGTAIGHHGLLMSPTGGTASYNSVVTAIAPNLWWRCDDTTGTTGTDHSAFTAHNPSLTGGASFSSTGVSVAAPSGYAGLGLGVDMAAASVTDMRASVISGTTPSFGGVSSSAWTIWLVVTGSAGGSQYLASRQNDLAVIYGFVADTVELFALGYSGSDPRPGSQISLPASDTTTPHLIMYRYNNGTYSGSKDKTTVFSVPRSFGLATSISSIYLGSDSGSSVSNSKTYDFGVVNRYVSDAERDAMVDAFNVP